LLIQANGNKGTNYLAALKRAPREPERKYFIDERQPEYACARSCKYVCPGAEQFSEIALGRIMATSRFSNVRDIKGHRLSA
jgi:hypothetical protein